MANAESPAEPIQSFNVRNPSTNPMHMWASNIPGGIALPGQVLEVPEEARAAVLKALEKGYLPKECLTEDPPISLEEMVKDESERERQRLPGMRPRKPKAVTALRKK